MWLHSLTKLIKNLGRIMHGNAEKRVFADESWSWRRRIERKADVGKHLAEILELQFSGGEDNSERFRGCKHFEAEDVLVGESVHLLEDLFNRKIDSTEVHIKLVGAHGHRSRAFEGHVVRFFMDGFAADQVGARERGRRELLALVASSSGVRAGGRRPETASRARITRGQRAVGGGAVLVSAGAFA